MRTSLSKSEKSEDIVFLSKILGMFIAIPIYACFLMWYNYVWIQYPLYFWQLMVFSCVILIFASNIKTILCLVLLGTIFGQILYWMSIIALPIIKL